MHDGDRAIKGQDRDSLPAFKLRQLHASRRRVSPEEFHRVLTSAGLCTSTSCSHEVRFHWFKAGPLAENVAFGGDCIQTHTDHTIARPMVCLEGASSSHKTDNKTWEIIKSGMDYVLGRSIVPASKHQLSEPRKKNLDSCPASTVQYRRHRLKSRENATLLSVTDASQTQSSQVLSSAEGTKEVADRILLLRRNAVAGALAGMCVSLCLHPVDTVKTVIQAQSFGERSILRTLLTIISDRGFLGLYRGLGSNLASSAPISGIYTFTYESVKAALLPHLPKEYHAIAHCAAGGCASVATSLVYTPSECVKQRMQLGSLYRNSWLAFLGILKNGGLSVLYSAWGAVLCRNVPQSVIKFYTYEALKHYALSGHPDATTLSTCQTLAFGGMAGSTAALFTTPFDVIKTRLQTQIPGSGMHQNGVLQTFRHIATSEGFGGLYRGLIPRLIIYVSQGALFFASYEFFKQLLAMEVKKISVLPCHSTDVVGPGNVVEPA